MKKDSQASLRINPDDIGYAISHIGAMAREEEVVVDPVAYSYATVANALRDFGFDSTVEANFDQVVRYKCALRAGVARRGLCLMGNVGTGKSLAMKFINGGGYRAQSLVRLYGKCREVFEDQCYGMPDLNVEIPVLTIDDLGAEPTYNDFGTKLEVMDELISLREVMFDERGHITNVTTNLSEAELDDRYGPRLMSRLKKMTNIVVFTGPDRRRTGNEEFMR